MSVFDDLTPAESAETLPSDAVLSPDEVIAALANEGDPVPTGIPWLEARLRRGGLTAGRILCVGGPPFAGKTTIIVDIALNLAQKIPVFALFSDEGRTQAAVRIGVMLGVSLEDIETDPIRAAPLIKERRGERSIYLVKPESPLGNVKSMFDLVASRVPKGDPAAVILDSVQTIPARPDTDMSKEREAIKDFMRVCRGRAEEDRRIVVASSQSNRESYRKRRAEENSVGITSFAGSASIEFLFDMGIVLSLPDEDSEIVRAQVVKNRLGHFKKRVPSMFYLRYDAESGKMSEVDESSLEAANADAATARLRPLKQKLLSLLKKASRDGGLSGAKAQELSGIRRTDVFAALKALVQDGLVFAETKGRNVLYVADTSREQ